MSILVVFEFIAYFLNSLFSLYNCVFCSLLLCTCSNLRPNTRMTSALESLSSEILEKKPSMAVKRYHFSFGQIYFHLYKNRGLCKKNILSSSLIDFKYSSAVLSIVSVYNFHNFGKNDFEFLSDSCFDENNLCRKMSNFYIS